MELKQIRELMAAMGRFSIKRLVLKEADFEIELEKEGDTVREVLVPHFSNPEERISKEAYAMTKSERQEDLFPKPPKDLPGIFVTSPMVGTFYASPSPEEPYFIKVGDKVDKNTLVCIVEAMKVMNEVKAGVSGEIAEICVQSGHPVEFGTKLFRVIPS